MRVDVAVLGGGPGGLLAAKAILTARPGLRVAVFERSADLTSPKGAHLGLQPNGFKALQAIDPALSDCVLQLDAGHTQRRVCTRDGECQVSAMGSGHVSGTAQRFGSKAYLGWHDLRLTLAHHLPEGVVHCGSIFERYEDLPGQGGVQLYFRRRQQGGGGGAGGAGAAPASDVPHQVCWADSNNGAGEASESLEIVHARVLVGCDGNQSAVRQQLLGDGPPLFMGSAIWRAVLPTAGLPCGWHGCQPRQAVWYDTAGGRRVYAVSLPGGRLSLLAAAPWPASRVGELLDASYVQEPVLSRQRKAAAKQRMLAAFGDAGWAPEVQQLLAAADPERLTEHGQFYREPGSCREWGRGCVSLLGDATHLGTPCLAQGTSQAFEDAVELGRAIGELGPTPAALRRYEAVRHPQAAAVQAASVALFREFREGRAGLNDELEANIALGFFGRTFAPLQPHSEGRRSSGASCSASRGRSRSRSRIASSTAGRRQVCCAASHGSKLQLPAHASG